MPDPTRRTVLAVGIAKAAMPSTTTDATPPEPALWPVKDSVVVMTECGTLAFLGVSRDAALKNFACGTMWCQYRFARHAGDTGAMAEAERQAREAGNALAVLLREQGYGKKEIAEHLREHERVNPNDFWRRWVE